ncbi:MAG: ATP-grasp domain-containing protein [Ignavibacteriales bacterium]|nr:ATP-grasp domain-containing protein [Ignavibacteriales bacterium]
MDVALVYNVKKEENSTAENDSQPSSLTQTTTHTQIQLATGADTYAEWDTIETIHTVRNALSLRHSVSLIEADNNAFENLKSSRPEIVFNIAEGRFGVSREAQIPAILDMLNIPYTGSDPLTLGICLDKSRAKEILSYYGIPTPKFVVVSSLSEIQSLNFSTPAMVKPLFEGSSKGIFNSSLVHTDAELKKQVQLVVEQYGEPALVEEFLPGREFTVAMLGNSDDLKVLPIVEIKFDSLPTGVNPIYSYEAKWIWDQSSNPLEIFDCPAKIDNSLQSEIAQICTKTYNLLRCKDWSRIDVRLDKNGRPNIIEINPLPGILPNPEDNSCFPKAARMAGISYEQMLNAVLDAACKRYELM